MAYEVVELRADADTRAARPWLAGSLLAGAGLVDVIVAYGNTVTDPYVVITAEGSHHLDITGWAWVHLAVGSAALLAGLAVLTGRRRWRLVGVGCAVAGIVTAVVVLPYLPVRAVLAVALYATALRLLLRHRRERPAGP
ncbi:hypothetical protein Van01_47700 [Micromonospora andamanensis]|uniref:DUF7144 domain-containing protein n=1 Tax=Micromonospora andamanensis TaxID=1287068 RepID=A0ABQ4I1A2_9ACTN|nr:hypothetical protein Van01_47700 [Micromonospora andamanensis]